MKQQVKILDIILKKLEHIHEPCFGKLYGIVTDNTILILGLQLDKENCLNLAYSFPAEIDFCGAFEVYQSKVETEKCLTICNNVDVTDNPIFIAVKLDNKNEILCNVVCSNQINNIKYTSVTKQEVYSDFTHVRLKGNFSLKSELNEEAISESFATLRKTVASGIMAFKLSKLNVLLTIKDSENGIIGLKGDPYFGDVHENVDGDCESSHTKKKGSFSFELEIVDINLVKNVTNDLLNADRKCHSPVVILDKKLLKLLKIPIGIDFLAIVHKKTRLSKLYNILLESTMKNLRLYESTLQDYLKQNTFKHSIDCPDIIHFFPKECEHFFTRIVFVESQDQQKKDRELLHDILLVNKTHPVFRKANRYQFMEQGTKNNGLLVNPHEGVKPTNNGGKICLVKGFYQYYHYCQNNMDDNGWGCAYRSLQTLASWFKLQGYTEKDVPSFKEIQTCLVDIGDKPSNFIDSRQWIGSTEVSYVLDSLLGVTCKILYVSSGEEMESKGSELVNHFETYGSPVMIGGGVLAHTILGVDYNQTTGDLKFLILDPHYTGGEDLKVIQNKGWCGWKGVEFWDKNSYYNMCLPQVPREV